MNLDLKDDFPILRNNITYLDSAASAQKPKVVIDCIKNYFENSYANIHRGVYSLSETSTALYDDARMKVAKFINADSYKNIVFLRNATEGINLIAYSLGRELIKEGDEILTTIMEHHSNIVPWQALAKEKNAVLKFVNINKVNFEIDEQDFIEKFTKKTKIFAFSLASNVTGNVTNSNKYIEIAKKNNCISVCDGAQFVPHHKTDVQELDVDFMVFSGHKMMSADGIGVLYGKINKLMEMRPFLYGGDMIESVTKEETTYADLPEKFEAGTPNMSGAISLTKAIEYIESVGIGKINQHEVELTKYAISELEKLGFIKFYIDTKNVRSGILSFNINGVHPHDAATILAENNVCVRAGQHCAAPLIEYLGEIAVLRASFYLYNNKEDVHALVEACKKAKEFFTI